MNNVVSLNAYRENRAKHHPSTQNETMKQLLGYIKGRLSYRAIYEYLKTLEDYQIDKISQEMRDTKNAEILLALFISDNISSYNSRKYLSPVEFKEAKSVMIFATLLYPSRMADPDCSRYAYTEAGDIQLIDFEESLNKWIPDKIGAYNIKDTFAIVGRIRNAGLNVENIISVNAKPGFDDSLVFRASN